MRRKLSAFGKAGLEKSKLTPQLKNLCACAVQYEEVKQAQDTSRAKPTSSQFAPAHEQKLPGQGTPLQERRFLTYLQADHAHTSRP